MARDTIIAWAHHTFNIAWGCTIQSAGCKNCYAKTLAKRRGFDVWGADKPRRVLSDNYWRQPIIWNRAAAKEGRVDRVFSSSMCDILEDHPTIAEQRERLFGLIRQTPSLLWLLLTKRPHRYAECLPGDWGEGYPNVWLGTSIENMDAAHRADDLRAAPAALRFVSYEPAIGPLDDLNLDGIGWVIYGGESGPGYRQHDLEWPRAMRRKCQVANIPFFFQAEPVVQDRDGRRAGWRDRPEIPRIRDESPTNGRL